MKFYKYFIYLLILKVIQVTSVEPPSVSVNYLAKKQWKLSKHDLADIKLDIEREMRSKILQVQMDWENRQRNEQSMMYNQFAPVIQPSFFSQATTQPAGPSQNNFPRFNELKDKHLKERDIEVNEKNAKMESIMGQTLEKIKKLKDELKIIKKDKNNLKLHKEINKKENKNYKQIMDNVINNDNINNIKNNKTLLISDEENKVKDIVKKYSTHGGTDELMVFENIFRNFNQTNSNKIDIKEVNEKIKASINNYSSKRLKNISSSENKIKSKTPFKFLQVNNNIKIEILKKEE